MKKAKKLISLCLGTILCANLLSGCGGAASERTEPAADTKGEVKEESGAAAESSDSQGDVNWITAEDISDMPETTIRYWYYETPERIELGQKQVEEFMELHPNIKVSGSVAPDNTDNEMLMTYIQSRTNSNIHQSLNIEDLWYVNNGLLYPLNNFPDFEEQMARMDPDLNYTWVDGNTYSISWYTSPNVMFYNKKMMEEVGWDPANPPQTYSEYFDFAQRVTDPANKRWAIAPWMGEEWWRWQFTMYPFYIAANGSNQTVAEDGQSVIFNNENMLKVYEFYEKLFDEGWAYKELWDIDPFITGQTASTRGQSDVLASVQNSAAEDFEFVIGPIPVPDGTQRGEVDTYGFVRNFCIIDELGVEEGEERDRVRRASWEFIKFLLSDEQCAKDFAVSGEYPCLKDVQENEVIKPVFEQFGDSASELLEVGKNSTISDMNTLHECDIMLPLQTAFLKVAYGEMGSKEALDWAESEANQILQSK